MIISKNLSKLIIFYDKYIHEELFQFLRFIQIKNNKEPHPKKNNQIFKV